MPFNQRNKKDSKELKKNIDVVVTSNPLRKRMSYRRSRRALLTMQVKVMKLMLFSFRRFLIIRTVLLVTEIEMFCIIQNSPNYV